MVSMGDGRSASGREKSMDRIHVILVVMLWGMPREGDLDWQSNPFGYPNPNPKYLRVMTRMTLTPRMRSPSSS